MKTIVPIAITPARLTSSNVAEADYAAYNGSTAYVTGNRVIYNHHIWEALASTTGTTPGAETTLPKKWLDLGATNRYKMFDKQTETAWVIGQVTENANSIDVTIAPGLVVDSIGFVGLDGTSVQVIMTDPIDGVVYNTTSSIVDYGASDWWEYFFKPFSRNDSLTLFDLPSYGSATIRVIISYTSSVAKCGMLVIGQRYDVGSAVYGTGIGYTSFSLTEVDDFGNVTIRRRGSKKYVDFDVRVDNTRVNDVTRTLDRLKDTPTIYSGEDSYNGVTIVMGLYDNLYTTIANPAVSEMNLTVRGLD